MSNKTFTLEQIGQALANVKSGADFPNYIRDIKEIGVTGYTTYVHDSHTDYMGENGFTVSSPGKYDALIIAESVNAHEFEKELKTHQQGKTDFKTFCNMCAECGIEKWIVSLDTFTCIYYDSAGNQVLAESIPQ